MGPAEDDGRGHADGPDAHDGGPAAFAVDGERVEPRPWTQGPWVEGTMHGSALAGILTRFVEAVPTAAPMRVTRLAFDLFRAAPIAPLTCTTRVVRDGLRIQSVDAELLEAGGRGRLIARCSAVRVRTQPHVLAAAVAPPSFLADAPPPLPHTGAPEERVRAHASFYAVGYHEPVQVLPGDDHRVVRWLRPRRRVVEGEPTSPLVRLATTADLSLTRGPVLIRERQHAINPDLTILVERYPEGGWLAVDSVVRFDHDGIGTSDCTVSDQRGRVAKVFKSVLIWPPD